MSEPDITKVPKATAADYLYGIAKAGVAAIPFVGGSAVEILSMMFAEPLTKRRDKWLESIVQGFERLKEQFDGISDQVLSQNEALLTALMHATQVATRNHNEEKRRALRNAVLNVAANTAPDENLQLMFLNLVDTFTPWHLRLLTYFNDPRLWVTTQGIMFGDMGGSVGAALEQLFPELQGRRDFYDQICRDLIAHGLINTTIDSLHIRVSSVLTAITTPMGKQFIKFISSPLVGETENRT